MMYRAKSKYFVYVCNIFHHNYLRYLAIINSLSLKHSLSIKVNYAQSSVIFQVPIFPVSGVLVNDLLISKY